MTRRYDVCSLWAWFAVLGVIVLMLAVDLVAQRKAHVIGVREAAAWSAVWVAAGIGFGVLLWRTDGSEIGQQYFAGYLIEKSLAVDNVFVWAIIFTYFAVPRELQHRVLFLGVLGALVLRGGFIAAGAIIIDRFSWVLYLFAAFLLHTGYRMLRQRNAHLDPEASMYFLLADLMHRFVYLKAGLALVMIWVGIKMALKIDVLYVPTWVSLTVVGSILTVSVWASLRATRHGADEPAPAEALTRG